MLDFKELSKDGLELEQMIREMLFTLGFKIFWSGKGPDGGKDLICIEEALSVFLPTKKKWLIQCKHKAESGKSVGVDDLDEIVDSCMQHDCEGYLLVTTTQPSSAVVQRLEQITSNKRNNIVATYWDSVELERRLNTAQLWNIAQRFLPKSASDWKIYASERPNHWTANYRGCYFHITNRIGSRCDIYLDVIESEIKNIESYSARTLPEKHFLRLRSFYFDDKSGCYSWYIDYMHPHTDEPLGSAHDFEKAFEGEWNHHYDFKVREYIEFSDHYDPDHYDYYDKYMGQFMLGMPRK